MAYDFHYTPTGTGVISGKEVLEQTEDAINDLGNTAISGVQEALDKAEQALTNSENAVDDAQTALNTANNAEGVAIQAQTDVGNLSGTVTNIGNRVTTAEGNITNLQGRMTTAEGNITNLQGRMTTAEGNIGNLQTAVSTAQATANSAQQTATTARQQAYVFRYSGTAVVPNSTIAYSTIDNTDNIKSGDKILDVDGKLFEITAVDTTNQTVTVGTALIDLAQDSDVVHKSGNETVGGEKTFTGALTASRNVANGEIILQNASYDPKTNGQGGVSTKSFSVNFVTALSDTFGAVSCYGVNDRTILRFTSRYFVDSQTVTEDSVEYNVYGDGSRSFKPRNNNNTMLGESTRKWKEVYANNYYYGANNVEFSTKFVTSDTTQTISGGKTFSSDITLQGTTTPIIKTISNIVQDTSAYNGSVSWVIRDKDNLNNILESALYKYSAKSIDWQLKLTGIDNGVSNTKGIRFTLDPVNDIANFIPIGNNNTSLGNSSAKWSGVYATNYYYGSNSVEFSTKFVTTDTNQTISGNKTFSSINGVEPSSLSLPDLSNGIDISSYITVVANANKESFYTPSVNGWISVALTRTGGSHAVMLRQGNFASSGHNVTQENGTTTCNAMLPVKGGVQVSINSALADGIAFAYFYPCQGNI